MKKSLMFLLVSLMTAQTVSASLSGILDAMGNFAKHNKPFLGMLGVGAAIGAARHFTASAPWDTMKDSAKEAMNDNVGEIKKAKKKDYSKSSLDMGFNAALKFIGVSKLESGVFLGLLIAYGLKGNKTGFSLRPKALFNI